MTKQQAEQAMTSHSKVEAGEGADRDTGYIHSIDGDMAMIGWDTGVSTPCAIADLNVA